MVAVGFAAVGGKEVEIAVGPGNEAVNAGPDENAKRSWTLPMIAFSNHSVKFSCHTPFGRCRISDRNSLRVSSSLRKQPSIDDVTAAECCFSTPAHHHAQMPRFDHHAHSLRFDHLLNRLRDLRGQPLLNLQAPREEFDQPRNLAQPDHPPFGM